MKQLLYYTLDSKFVSDQKAVGGKGDKVVSVVNGVAWTKDERKAYYRYKKPDSGNITSYTITIHYKDINGNSIAADDVVTVEGYSGYGVSKTIMAKSISGYTVLTDDVKTFIMDTDIEHTFKYNDTPLEEVPLTFYILSSGTITWTSNYSYFTRTIQYSKNGGGWTTITANTGSSTSSIYVSAGDIVKFKGDNSSYGSTSNRINCFSSSTPDLRFNAYGNIMSLINSTDFKNLKTFTSASAFTGLFSGCTSLVNADGLLLPTTALTNYCYLGMFSGCTNLTTAPELPARELAYGSCQYMFAGCTSLTVAPSVLPAKTLAESCYEYMFSGCTSLTIAPELPARELVYRCYSGMFAGCSSLIQAPELPAETLADSCYVVMFSRCTSLTIAPELPARELVYRCYKEMFYGCTSLTKAPELPATTLVDWCYQYMFEGCTSLNYVKAMFTTEPQNLYTYNWLKDVASSGTFEANSAATWTSSFFRGSNTVPSNWTITNATS